MQELDNQAFTSESSSAPAVCESLWWRKRTFPLPLCFWSTYFLLLGARAVEGWFGLWAFPSSLGERPTKTHNSMILVFGSVNSNK